MIINKIQEFFIHFLQTNHLVTHQISPTNFIFLKAFNSEFQEIKVMFIDKNSQPLETKDRIKLTLVKKTSR